MSKGQMLRALVKERLAAAAEDIFILFERTILEYEEELCRSKEENQRKQRLLDHGLNRNIKLIRGNVQIPSTSPGPNLNQEITETPQIKEEPEDQSVKQEEEQLPLSVPGSSVICMKTEESSVFQHRQTEHAAEAQGEDTSSEPHSHSQTEGHTEVSAHSDDSCSFSCSAPQMETEADGDHFNQVQVSDRSFELSSCNKSAPVTTVHKEDTSEANWKRHECCFCQKKFSTKQILYRHFRVHTGEKPFMCSICNKMFAQKGHLDTHNRIHTGEKPHSCPVCNKAFIIKSHLERHRKVHTGQKPYSCSFCNKTFAQKASLEEHLRRHTGEKPFSCPVCNKAFYTSSNLCSHMKTHRRQNAT